MLDQYLHFKVPLKDDVLSFLYRKIFPEWRFLCGWALHSWSAIVQNLYALCTSVFCILNDFLQISVMGKFLL